MTSSLSALRELGEKLERTAVEQVVKEHQRIFLELLTDGGIRELFHVMLENVGLTPTSIPETTIQLLKCKLSHSQISVL